MKLLADQDIGGIAPLSNGNDAQPGRVPPCDLAAEASLLGAMLLSRDAIADAIEVVGPEHFYKPGHAHIFDAMVSLYRAGDPADAVTVAHELQRAGLLEAIGGAGALVELQATTPAISSAAKYAGIIHECAMLRRLIGVAHEVTEAVHSGADVADVVGGLRTATDELEHAGRRGLSVVDLTTVIDCAQPAPIILARTDGEFLFYDGAVNYVFGPPGRGKTTTAAIVVAERLAQGGTVLYVDFEDSAGAVVSRLLALGVERRAMVDRFLYVTGPHAVTTAQIVNEVLGGVTLVVFDGIAAAMAGAGLDEDSSTDTNRFWDRLLAPPAQAGACVLASDHVTKSTESRGLWPRGSGAKRARIDGAAYMVDSSARPFNRTTAGAIKLVLAKDRHGGVAATEGSTAASIYIDPRGGRMHYTVDAPLPEVSTTPDEAQPVRADLLTAIPQALERAGRPLSTNDLESHLRSKPYRLKFTDKDMATATRTLEVDGLIVIEVGSRRSKMHRLPTPPEPPPQVARLAL